MWKEAVTCHCKTLTTTITSVVITSNTDILGVHLSVIRCKYMAQYDITPDFTAIYEVWPIKQCLFKNTKKPEECKAVIDSQAVGCLTTIRCKYSFT
jgi:hypothetical protein